ncbi:MAG: hypothetical protein J4445_00010 [DPANN group archaeon]|nr:hypothetical protein [DPANN group archaeon]
MAYSIFAYISLAAVALIGIAFALALKLKDVKCDLLEIYTRLLNICPNHRCSIAGNRNNTCYFNLENIR